jgi:hypothetical protein
MHSLRAPKLRRGLRLFLGAQASLPAYFDRLVFWLIVKGFLLTTSPTLFAQTNDNVATAGGRIAEAARIRAFGPGRWRVHFPQSPHALRNALHDGAGAQVERKGRREGHPASRLKPDATKLVK